MSNVHNSKKSFSNIQRTGLVGGCNKFLTFFKMKVVEGHLVYLRTPSLAYETQKITKRFDSKVVSVSSRHSMKVYRGR